MEVMYRMIPPLELWSSFRARYALCIQQAFEYPNRF